MRARSERSGRPRHFVRAGAAVLALGLVASCGGGSDSGSGSNGTSASENVNAPPTTEDPNLKPVAGGKLVFGLVAETDGWDPTKSRWAASGLDVSNAIFDKLTAFAADGTIQPNLAQTITADPAFKEWTIKLRPGIKFHDGSAVDAEAVRKNLQAQKDSPLTGGALGPIEKISIKGEDVVVNMSSPWSTFPITLAGQVGTVASPKQLDSPDGTQKPVGSGPFKFESWAPNSKLIVKKNTEYWQKGLPLLDEIEFRTITDNQSRSASLRSKDIDGMESYDPETTDTFRNEGSGEFRVLRDPKSEEDEALVMLNTSKPPFNDPLARSAMAHATDAKAVAELLSPNLEVATGPYAPESPFHVDSGYPGYDPEKAKQEVEEFKAKNGGKFAFQLEGVPVVEVQKVEQLLQQQWAAVGMEVNLNNVEQAPLINQAIAGGYQATMWRQFASPSPDGEYVWWSTTTVKPEGQISLNFARNKNDSTEEALQAARSTSDLAKQKESWGTVQKNLAKDLPYIWLYHVQAVIIASQRVHDLTKWNLPDGTPGLGQISVLHPWAQVWVQ